LPWPRRWPRWPGANWVPEFAITLTLLGVLAGVVVRSAGGGALVMLGTVILGVAITIGNIVVPLIIRRDFSPVPPGRGDGHLHRGAEYRLVPDLRGLRAPG
jgi:hypothetical protein